MGPDTIGDEFDEALDDEEANPAAVFDVLDVTDDHTLTVLSATDETVKVGVVADSVRISVSVNDQVHEWTVPRSALVEAFQDIGLIEP